MLLGCSSAAVLTSHTASLAPWVLAPIPPITQEMELTMKTTSNWRSSPDMRRIGLSALIAGTSFLMAACASTPAPTEQMAVSGAAVTRAAGAGGTEMAPAEMQTAREKLDRAKLAMSKEDYDTARNLAEEAQVDAQLAEAKARSGKARKAADELQEGIRVLREELNRKTK